MKVPTEARVLIPGTCDVLPYIVERALQND